MAMFRIAAHGLEDNEVVLLKSLFKVVAPQLTSSWTWVSAGQEADAIILSAGTCAAVEGPVLIYLVGRQEAHDSDLVLRRPLRPSSVVEILRVAETLLLASQRERLAVTAAPLAIANWEAFDMASTWVGQVHAMMPRINIDKEIWVNVTDFPPLIIDCESGVRRVVAGGGWFESYNPWRGEAQINVFDHGHRGAIKGATKEGELKPRPYNALRFWGALAVSKGRLASGLSATASYRLSDIPKFRVLPHQPEHVELAQLWHVSPRTLPQLIHQAKISEIVAADFANACHALGLLEKVH